ncbi:PIH1 domain-containing protein 1 isoform X4 [Canis lupus baileyi]|uniref:PIH1 domain-containing protein 1 isoform X4 n=1 Tax=Canis lupus baileyi TaxID=143281 RepID=UPI0003AD7A88
MGETPPRGRRRGFEGYPETRVKRGAAAKDQGNALQGWVLSGGRSHRSRGAELLGCRGGSRESARKTRPRGLRRGDGQRRTAGPHQCACVALRHGAMADSKLLVPELSEAEKMGADTARFEELLLQASKELQQAQTSRPESTQIQPQPGFCIKTNSSEGKVFINICHSPSIPPPADMTEDELLQMLEEDQAGFRIPMSLGEPHAELDAKGQGCTAYDVAVNSDFYRRMQNSDFLRELVVTIAREGLEDKYSLQLNPEWRMLKNRPFLGSISQQNIRSQQRPRIQELGNLYTPDSLRPEEGPEKPHLNLWLEAPDLLLAEIDLPKLDGALGLSLEIGENRLVMGGPQQLYHLDAYIPLRINSEESKAAFHRKRKQLMVAMPLLSVPS